MWGRQMRGWEGVSCDTAYNGGQPGEDADSLCAFIVVRALFNSRLFSHKSSWFEREFG